METAINFSEPMAIDDKDFFKEISEKLISYIFRDPSIPRKANRISKKAQKKIPLFIVDDDILYLKALELSISSNIGSLAIYSFQTGEECLQLMKKKPAIVILDYYLNSEISRTLNGMAILKKIKKINPSTKVIMLSSQDSLNVAV